jgi:hypothetical protein
LIFYFLGDFLRSASTTFLAERVGGLPKVPPSELAAACYYDDIRNGTANHGQGEGNSKRSPIFDRQSSATKFQNQINLRGRYVCISAINGYTLIFLIFVFYFLSGIDI